MAKWVVVRLWLQLALVDMVTVLSFTVAIIQQLIIMKVITVIRLATKPLPMLTIISLMELRRASSVSTSPLVEYISRLSSHSSI